MDKLNITCDICNLSFSSKTNYFVHKREIHTHKNTELKTCLLCENDFYSPCMNKNKQIYYLKCEKCRKLQIELSTNHIQQGDYVYHNNQRYLIKKGYYSKVCLYYKCIIENCDLDLHNNLKKCSSTCNKFILQSHLNCDNCALSNEESKNKHRINLISYKKQLGGKCINCNENKLYLLEFDHINPTTKEKQITKCPQNDNIQTELKKCQLLCRNCHRLKTYNEKKITMTRKYKYIKKKLNFVNEIKCTIKHCQNCNLECHDKNTVIFDFDHIPELYNKFKQVSNLIDKSKDIIISEIKKCRFLCSNCHTEFNLIQYGHKINKFYNNEDYITYLEYKHSLENRSIQNEFLVKIINQLL